jgi:hypothetical protein
MRQKTIGLTNYKVRSFEKINSHSKMLADHGNKTNYNTTKQTNGH